MKEFNDSTLFDKELTDTLFTLLMKEIKEVLEYAITTKDNKALSDIKKVISKYKFKDNT